VNVDRSITGRERIEVVTGVQALAGGQVHERVTGDQAALKVDPLDRGEQTEDNGHGKEGGTLAAHPAHARSVVYGPERYEGVIAARSVHPEDPPLIGGKSLSDLGTAPLVVVIVPALNEAGKIGRVLDKVPDDPRFEVIVIDDGSTDGTGDEARAHGASYVLRHQRREGVGASIRDGWRLAMQLDRPYVALLSGDDQHEPGELVAAFDALLRRNADYAQGSRWMPGGRVVGPAGGRGIATRLYSWAFSLLVFKRVTDATNGFRVFRTKILRDPSVNLDQEWLTSYDLEPYLLYKAITRGYRVIEVPCTVRYHAREGYTKMRGIRDWWRLFRPALLLRAGVKR